MDRQPYLRGSNSQNSARQRQSARNRRGSVHGGGINSIFDYVTKGTVDYVFLGIVAVLIAYGVIMLFSASSGVAYSTYGNAYKFVLNQGVAILFGAICMYVTSKLDYHVYQKLWGVLYVVGLCLLVLVLVAGKEVNGAKRWLFGVQPSEAAKAIMVIVIAYTLSLPHNQKELRRKTHGLGDFGKSIVSSIIVPHGLLLILYIFLLYKEPHFSCILLIVAVSGIMFVVAGLPLKTIVVAGSAVVAILLVYGLSEPYRMVRFVSFGNPFADMQGSGYQIVQSLYAIGSGGFFGVGLGKSRQKFMSLPEPHNDFIFSVLCEELGFVGAVLLIALFIFLLYRGLKIAKNAPDLFGVLIAVGFVMQIVVQAAGNIAVVTASMPVTGIPLPFFSYGGTAMVVTMAEMGIVLNVSRQSKMLI